jgi:hypothetical protein
VRCSTGRTNTIEMCRREGSGSPMPSSNRPGSASAMPTMPGRSATNGRASDAESFARTRAVRSGPCGAPRAMLAFRHTSTAESSSWGSMLRTFTGESYARLPSRRPDLNSYRGLPWRAGRRRAGRILGSVLVPGRRGAEMAQLEEPGAAGQPRLMSRCRKTPRLVVSESLCPVIAARHNPPPVLSRSATMAGPSSAASALDR